MSSAKPSEPGNISLLAAELLSSLRFLKISPCSEKQS